MLDWRALPLRLAATLHRIEWRLIGCPGSRPPDSILAALTDPDTGGTGNVQSFDSPEDFEAALAAMKGG